jgi:hypothetical protein
MANFFPRWMNTLPLKVVLCLGVLGVGAVAGVSVYFTPKYGRVGYMPSQPVAFSHKLHAGQLGMDCRYCHSYVESSPHSNVPSSSTCWNCHRHVKPESPRLELVRRSADETYEGYDGKPVEWVHIHRPPDYAYFDHSAHVNRGVSCASCHGKVNEMTEVWHAEPHSMGWCLDCHRNPEKHLRPLAEVFNLDWAPDQLDRRAFYGDLLGNGAAAGEVLEALGAKAPGGGADLEAVLAHAAGEFGESATQAEVGLVLKHLWNINPPESCAGCHR